MFTSYYGNIKRLPQGKAVAISQGVPVWFHGPKVEELCPPWSLIRLKNPVEYTKRYLEQLLPLNPEEIRRKIEGLAGQDAILMCWEKPGEFCHRQLVSQWFKNKLGITVPEYGQNGLI